MNRPANEHKFNTHFIKNIVKTILDFAKANRKAFLILLVALFAVASLLFSALHESSKEILTAINDHNRTYEQLDSNVHLKIFARQGRNEQELVNYKGKVKYDLSDIKQPAISITAKKGSKFDNQKLPKNAEIRLFEDSLYLQENKKWQSVASNLLGQEFQSQLAFAIEQHGKYVDLNKADLLATNSDIYDVEHKDGEYIVGIKEGVHKYQVLGRTVRLVNLKRVKKLIMAQFEAQSGTELTKAERKKLSKVLDAILDKDFLDGAITQYKTEATYDDQTYALKSMKLVMEVDLKYVATEVQSAMYGPLTALFETKPLNMPDTINASLDLEVRSTDSKKITIQVPEKAKSFDQSLLKGLFSNEN